MSCFAHSKGQVANTRNKGPFLDIQIFIHASTSSLVHAVAWETASDHFITVRGLKPAHVDHYLATGHCMGLPL